MVLVTVVGPDVQSLIRRLEQLYCVLAVSKLSYVYLDLLRFAIAVTK